MSGESRLVRVERRGDIAVLWMCDEKRRNALSTTLVREMLRTIATSKEQGVRGLVIASDQKVFCAGADVRDMLDNGWMESGPKMSVVTPPQLFQAIEGDTRPLIAAVDGLAVGGGVELCLACDLLVVGPQAMFTLPELQLGILPNTAIARLPELIGRRAAADLILTRRKVLGREAVDLGLASAFTLDPVTQSVALAASMCSGIPPLALAAAKRLLGRGRDWVAIDNMLQDMDGLEWREGVSAFLEKRSPDYNDFWNALGEK